MIQECFYPLVYFGIKYHHLYRNYLSDVGIKHHKLDLTFFIHNSNDFTAVSTFRTIINNITNSIFLISSMVFCYFSSISFHYVAKSFTTLLQHCNIKSSHTCRCSILLSNMAWLRMNFPPLMILYRFIVVSEIEEFENEFSHVYTNYKYILLYLHVILITM